MTHDELTLLIIKLSGDDTVNWKFYPALRAVVKLHNPVTHKGYKEAGLFCDNCDFDYPCPTIQAIEKELAK